MEQGVVADELFGEVPVGLAAGEDTHLLQVFGPLDVEDVVGGPVGEQREHHLGVQGALEVGLGVLRLGQPPGDVGDPGVGHGVALAFGARPGFHRLHLDQSVLQEPGEGGVHLAVGERSLGGEALVVGPFEVVSVLGPRFQ